MTTESDGTSSPVTSATDPAATELAAIDPAAIDTALRAEHRAHLRAVRFTGPAGNFAAGIVVLALVRGTLPEGRLLTWFGVVVLLSALMVAAFSIERSAQWTNDEGTPLLSLAAHGAVGCAWGSVLWLGPDVVMDRETIMTLLAVLFAMTAGAVGGIQPSNLLARVVVAPMWLLTSVRLVQLDEPQLAVGTTVFLVLMVSDLRAGAALFRQAIRFRLISEATARAATDEAQRDTLTGLPNRTGLERQVEAVLERPITGMTVLFVDLDNFKDINDRFGHHTGDRVLQVVAERLRARTDPDTVVARFGGDEFFLAVPDELTPSALASLTDRLIGAIEDPIAVDGPDRSFRSGGAVAMVSASIGTSTLPADSFDIERAYVEADQALYEAKDDGRRRARSFGASGTMATVGVASRLREALAARTLEWWAQPVIDLDTGRIVAAELLARWPLPDGTMVPPDVFIPVADSSGLIGDLTRQALDAAAASLEQWRDHPVLADAAISVNLSARYLAERTLLDDLVATFGPFDLAQGRLWLELTESHDLSAMSDVDEALAAAHRLGARVAVDDFGTGYTSVRQLHDLPVSIVKLDRWLAEELDTTGSRASLARAVQSVATTLGHRTVAEGIERVGQIGPVRALGIDLAQGHLFARPMPISRLEIAAVRIESDAAVHLGVDSRHP